MYLGTGDSGSMEKNKAKLEKKIQAVLGEINTHIKLESGHPNNKKARAINSALLKEKLSELNVKL